MAKTTTAVCVTLLPVHTTVSFSSFYYSKPYKMLNVCIFIWYFPQFKCIPAFYLSMNSVQSGIDSLKEMISQIPPMGKEIISKSMGSFVVNINGWVKSIVACLYFSVISMPLTPPFSLSISHLIPCSQKRNAKRQCMQRSGQTTGLRNSNETHPCLCYPIFSILYMHFKSG